MVEYYLRKRYKMDTWYGRTGYDVDNYVFWSNMWLNVKMTTLFILLGIVLGVTLANV
jgi:hypothetical protein